MDAEPDKRLHWGVYDIQDEEMEVQYWIMPSGSGYPAPQFKGEILTDTSFYLMSKHSPRDTFYFRQYSPKPDSTNQFID